ncbi:uncharacterized protein LOC129372157 [Poeciliopsis prolifica]|uniref:uncharacterized protein LOC129372157 n=1 Tax=Poeciliopsis prolifica TaxID=188132 RepID=UPI002412FD73|nr:uncharacterized protein LOC129372157 [Poeciliopsis prolifica]
MAASRRKTGPAASRFRSRQQAANDRRFCIVWINKMVNKQVEKKIAELQEEIFLMYLELRVQMGAKLKEHLGEAVVTQRRKPPESNWSSDTEEMETLQPADEEGGEKSQSDSDHPTHSSAEPDQGFRKTLSAFSEFDLVNTDIRGTDIKHFPGDDRSASQEAQREPISPSGVPAVCDSCKLMTKSEEKKCPHHPSQMFTGREEERDEDKAKVEQDALMKAQWKEWLDKQEMKGKKRHEERNVQRKGMRSSSSDKQMTKTKKSGQIGTMKKIKTYISEFFNPSEKKKWDILCEED